jgi:hypothetical protein
MAGVVPEIWWDFTVCQQTLTVFRFHRAIRFCPLLCFDAEHFDGLDEKKVQEREELGER